MALQDEIKRAIGMHGLWKSRLTAAIDTRSADVTPDAAGADHQCEFGKWLYGAQIAKGDKGHPQYEVVRKLHAAFHQSARQVLVLALAGRAAEARSLLTDAGAFTTASSDLTREMMKWVTIAKAA